MFRPDGRVFVDVNDDVARLRGARTGKPLGVPMVIDSRVPPRRAGRGDVRVR